jgi:hypothetical protein
LPVINESESALLVGRLSQNLGPGNLKVVLRVEGVGWTQNLKNICRYLVYNYVTKLNATNEKI